MTLIRSYLEALSAMDDRPLTFAEGTLLFAEGAPGREMYIVRTGTVVLRAGSRELETVGPGGVIGEMSLIDPAPRSASAVAGVDCTVTSVTEHTFQDLIKKIPGLAIEMMRIITRRLRKANEKATPEPRAAGRPRRSASAGKPAKAPSRPAARGRKRPATRPATTNKKKTKTTTRARRK
jgi:CRP/FNR family cyclic AMP-dependent transcriptional regulator